MTASDIRSENPIYEPRIHKIHTVSQIEPNSSVGVLVFGEIKPQGTSHRPQSLSAHLVWLEGFGNYSYGELEIRKILCLASETRVI